MVTQVCLAVCFFRSRTSSMTYSKWRQCFSRSVFGINLQFAWKDRSC